MLQALDVKGPHDLPLRLPEFPYLCAYRCYGRDTHLAMLRLGAIVCVGLILWEPTHGTVKGVPAISA